MHQCRTANRKMVEAQGFKWEEAFHRYAVGQQLYMHTKWCCEQAHIYIYVHIHTHSLLQVQHTLMRMQNQQTHSHGLPITLLLEAEQAGHVCTYICANAAED